MWTALHQFFMERGGVLALASVHLHLLLWGSWLGHSLSQHRRRTDAALMVLPCVEHRERLDSLADAHARIGR